MTKITECEHNNTVMVSFIDHEVRVCSECKAFQTAHGESGELDSPWQPITDYVDDMENVLKAFKNALKK